MSKKIITSRERNRAIKFAKKKLTQKEKQALMYNTVAYRLAKARDKWGLISIITFLCLLVSIYFNFQAYWPV